MSYFLQSVELGVGARLHDSRRRIRKQEGDERRIKEGTRTMGVNSNYEMKLNILYNYYVLVKY